MHNEKTGYDSLLLGFTNALEDNSKIIGDALEALASRKLSEKDKKELRSIKRDLKRIDSSLNNLGQ